ncbi:MAG: SAM-dependent methyltransferase [Bacteroidetes bacterium]|nr:SAM-dependent methyltransferase [Bacteroidota bacterium]
MQLYDIITRDLQVNGPISFHDYMDTCLYYPELGYYTSPGPQIGPEGDFYTSCSLGSVFGVMLAEQLKEMWQLTGEKEFTIVEYGAGNGFLCHDILDRLSNYPALYEKLNYCIIEKSAAMRAREKAHLDGKVSWLNSIDEVKGFTGCVLSNELVDNLAMHKVVTGDQLMETFVEYDNGCIRETLRPAGEALVDYFRELRVQLPKGYTTEVNLEATEWMKEIATAMGTGFILTIDYGYTSAELYNTERSGGTMRCYNMHKMNGNPYINIGKQDITAHVNFTALYHWGLKHGLKGSGFTDQANFLADLGIDKYMRQNETNPAELRKNLQIRNRLLGDMGSKFKVLVQEKNVRCGNLSGLRHLAA